MVEAWLAPGAQIPLVFHRSSVWFTAGATTYEFKVFCEDPPFAVVQPQELVAGTTTTGRTTLTPEQRILLIALAEPILRRTVRGPVNAPTSAEAADRLGWTITKFNRKLDQVCQKLERMGVRGLHGGPERLAIDGNLDSSSTRLLHDWWSHPISSCSTFSKSKSEQRGRQP